MFTGLHGFVVALFAGALASAEERGLGTLEWQALLPYPVWRAWAVKVATMFGLVLVLALGLPVLLSFAGPVAGEWRAAPVVRMSWGINGVHWFFLWGAALVAVSLYVSSLCTSALRALLVSFPVVVVGGSLVVAVVTTVNGYLWRGLGVQATLNDIWRRGFTGDERRMLDMFVWLSDLTAMALALGFIGALLWLACRNHHAALSRTSVPRGQVAGVVTGLVVASVAAGAVQPVLLALGLRAG
jgi:hypothetical protein